MVAQAEALSQVILLAFEVQLISFVFNLLSAAVACFATLVRLSDSPYFDLVILIISKITRIIIRIICCQWPSSLSQSSYVFIATITAAALHVTILHRLLPPNARLRQLSLLHCNWNPFWWRLARREQKPAASLSQLLSRESSSVLGGFKRCN